METTQENTPKKNRWATIRNIFIGEFLNVEFVKRNRLLLLVVFFILMHYVHNRYSMQRKIVEIDKLKKERLDARYEALSVSSELTVRTRQSKLEDYIGDTENGVKVPNQPPYVIKTEKK